MKTGKLEDIGEFSPPNQTNRLSGKSSRLPDYPIADYPNSDYPTKMHSAIGAVGIQVGSRNFTDCRLQKQSSRQSAIEKLRGFFRLPIGGG
jgi:hypothetical protein